MLGRCRLGYNIISLTMLVIKQKAKRWLSCQYIAYTDRHSFSRPRDITSTVQRQCVKAAHGSSQYPKSQTVMQSHCRESKESRSLVSRLGDYFISSSQPPTQRQRHLSSTHQLRVVYLYTGRTSSINGRLNERTPHKVPINKHSIRRPFPAQAGEVPCTNWKKSPHLSFISQMFLLTLQYCGPL